MVSNSKNVFIGRFKFHFQVIGPQDILLFIAWLISIAAFEDPPGMAQIKNLSTTKSFIRVRIVYFASEIKLCPNQHFLSNVIDFERLSCLKETNKLLTKFLFLLAY